MHAVSIFCCQLVLCVLRLSPTMSDASAIDACRRARDLLDHHLSEQTIRSETQSSRTVLHAGWSSRTQNAQCTDDTKHQTLDPRRPRRSISHLHGLVKQLQLPRHIKASPPPHQVAASSRPLLAETLLLSRQAKSYQAIPYVRTHARHTDELLLGPLVLPRDVLVTAARSSFSRHSVIGTSVNRSIVRTWLDDR